MTYAPQDLMDVRSYVMGKTGLTAVECGIVGDPAHAETGGYHEGNDDLMAAGVFYTDYSKADSSRDRPGSNAASALDVGLYWDDSAGGRNRAIAFSNWVADKLTQGDPRLNDMRGMNWTPDGVNKRRIDRLYNNFQTTSSSDSVDIHTHFEWFRDSEGRRSRLDNFLGLVKEFFGDVPPPAPSLPLEERMPDTQLPKGFDQNDTVLMGFPTTEAHGVTLCIDTGKQPHPTDPTQPDVDVLDAWFRVVAHSAVDANGSWGVIQVIKCNSQKRRVDYSWPATANVDRVSIRRIPAFTGDLGLVPASVMKF